MGGTNSVSLSASTLHKITANSQISIKPGVHLGAFNTDGGTHLKITPKAPFDVAVMNYPNLDAVLKYEKFELGIELPQDILEKVTNFINKEQVSNSEKINPYLDWELRVFAEFSQIGEAPIIIDGFFTKEFEVWNLADWNTESLPLPADGLSYTKEEYLSLGGWDELPTDFPFRIRFAPPSIGDWKVVVKILKNGDELESIPFVFHVIESGNKGYMSAGKRFLKYDNHTFYPIGLNHCWPETDINLDQEMLDNNIYVYPDGNTVSFTEGSRPYIVAPRVYQKYRSRMDDFADNGANYLRTIMCPSSTEIEWEELGNYTKRLSSAQEMDQILEKAKERSLFLHWNLQLHYSFQLKEYAYYRNWTWDDEIDGNLFCYRTLIESDFPPDFFIDEEAKMYYKQRLRYVLARWGYSTNIAVWELFSEISNVGTNGADANVYYMTGTNWERYASWQKEMANYLKSQYHGNIHLVTTNYGGEKHKDDNTFTDNAFDIMTSNIYDFSEPNFSDFFINSVSKSILNESINTSYSFYNEKPMIFSETDPYPSYCDYNAIEQQREMWQSMFSGLAGSLSWTLGQKPHLWHLMREMNTFISQFDLEAERWHPGASEIHDFSDQRAWIYNEDYAKFMDNNQKEPNKEETKLADIAYLRSVDGNFAIGVLTNKSYNVYSVDDCFDAQWDAGINYGSDSVWNYPIKTSDIVDAFEEKLKVKGMNSGKYYINYFLPSNFSEPIHSDENQGPQVRIRFNVPATETAYIIPFMIRKKGHSFMPQQSKLGKKLEEQPFAYMIGDTSSIENINPQFKLYPNPFQNEFVFEKDAQFEKVNLIVFTTEGKEVKQLEITNKTERIDMRSWEAGNYFVHVSHFGQILAHFKIIKL